MFYIVVNFVSIASYDIMVLPRTGGSLVEHRAVMWEVVSWTPVGPTLRALK